MAFEEADKYECPVCLEYFDLYHHKRIRCGCGRCVCIECCMEHLESTMEDPHCLHCMRVWDERFLMENLGTKETKQRKEHRKEVLFQRELAKMPQTQPIVKMMKDAKHLMNQLKTYNRKLMKDDVTHEEREFLELRVNELSAEHHEILIKLESVKQNKHTESIVQHIQNCPVSTCKGFITKNYKCGLCDTTICRKCLEIKGDGHECKQEHVKTAEKIMKETRPCPRCATRIYKIDGCDQMWCTNCHAAFSWKTGRIETGRVHNPHFFEYMRENPDHTDRPERAVGEVECGGIIRHSQVREILTTYRYILRTIPTKDRHLNLKETPFHKQIYNIYRSTIHTQDVLIDNIRERVNKHDPNQDLRIKYLMEEKTKRQVMNTLIRRERLKNKRREMMHVLELFQTVANDHFRNLYEKSCEMKKDFECPHEYVRIMNEHAEKMVLALSKVQEYTVEAFTRIQETYNMGTYMIMPVTFDFHSSYCMLRRNEYDERTRYV